MTRRTAKKRFLITTDKVTGATDNAWTQQHGRLQADAAAAELKEHYGGTVTITDRRTGETREV